MMSFVLYTEAKTSNCFKHLKNILKQRSITIAKDLITEVLNGRIRES